MFMVDNIVESSGNVAENIPGNDKSFQKSYSENTGIHSADKHHNYIIVLLITT